MDDRHHNTPAQAPANRRLPAFAVAMVLAAAAALSGPAAALAAPSDITTVAGNGVNGYGGDGGSATSAQMMTPAGVAFGSAGDLYIADFFAHTVRMVNTSGTISTIAGTGVAGYSGDGGLGTAAQLNMPADVVTDAAGNVYVADFGNHRIRRISPGGTISVFAGTGTAGYSGDSGPALLAQLYNPAGLDIDAAGNLYVTEYGNGTVRKITPLGVITTLAGNGVNGYGGDGGPATAAQMNAPTDVVVDGDGTAYIAELYGHRVRKVSPGGTITTLAGTGVAGNSGNGGPATAAQLSGAAGVDIDSTGNVFIAEYGNHDIRKVTPAGNISRVAGTGTAGSAGDGGPALSAELNTPSRVTLSPSGDFYISDWGNHRVRHVEALGTPASPTFSGSTPASPSPSNSPAIRGTSSFGSTVRLYTNAICTSALAAGGTASQFASPGLSVSVAADSTTTFYAKALDAGGNESGCSTSSLTYVEDSTAPAAPAIGSSPTSPGNDQTPTWSFTGEAGAAFECRLMRGATTVSNWAACPSPETYDLSAQADGTYDLSVRAVDAAGNTGAATSSSYILDHTPPAAPSIGSAPSSPDDDTTPTWAFTGEAGAAFECQIARGATVVSDWASCTSAKTYDLSSEVDGAYTFSVRATDGVGNTGAEATSAYTLDRTAPAAPSIDTTPPSPDNDTTPTWSFSSEAGATFECRIARGATVVSNWASCTSAKTYDLSSEVDGDYDFSVRATDVAGNTGAAATSSYGLDTAAPAAPSIGSAPSSPDDDTTPTWSFSGEASAAFECRLMRGATVVSNWAVCTDPESYDLSAEADGTYDFSVRATDVAGNTGPAATSSYQLDRTAPAAPSFGSLPSSPGSDDTPTWAFSGEAGASFECLVMRGATVVSGWASCSSPETVDLSAQPDGSYSLSVRATDAAGNTGSAGSSSYVLDRTPPAAPSIDTTPPSPDNDTTPTWSFSSEAGAAFECRIARGATVVSNWASCTSAKTYDLGSEVDGDYDFSVRAIDAAGNTGSAASSSYRLDTTAPSVPSIGSGPAALSADDTPTWSFSSEAGAAFECRLMRGATVVGDWAACTDPKTYNLAAETDGDYDFLVRATDSAGNTGAAATSSYRLDRVAPAAPAIDLAPASPGNSRSPAWQFSGEAGAAFECRLTRGATVVSGWAACSGTRMYDLLLEPDGTYTFSVRATDGAGNTGTAATSSYVLDTTAPAAPSIGSPPASPGNDQSPAWGFSGEAGAAFECRLERGATVVSNWAACSDPKTFDLSSEPDGDYDFSVRATDAAGNTGAAAISSYRLDTSAPAAPSIGSAPASPDDDATPTWSFSGEAGAAMECRLERGATVVSNWAVCSDPKTYDLSSEADGDYDFRVRARDAAGNTGAAATSSYRLDRAAPSAPAFGSVPVSPGNDATPTWAFSGEAGAAFECLVMRGAMVVSGWASCSSTQTVDLSAQPDGSYSLSVRATDAAGNTGSAASSSYELDRVAPGAPSIDASPASPGNDESPSWSFSGEAGAAFECRLERGATTVSGWASCSDPKTYDISSEPDGGYRFSVRARDAAGNTGAAATSDYELDSAAPAAPAIGSAPASPGNDPTPSWSFSGEAGAALECRLERGATVVSGWAGCSDPKAFDLSSEPDGDYDFSVRATDAAGNTGPAATSAYRFDTAPPADPTIDSEPASPSADTTPAWSFSGPAGAALECRLERGATVVSDWAGCASPLAYALGSEPDGDYSFLVRARDDAGNLSGSDSSLYILDRSIPAVPTIDAAPDPVDNDATPSWGFSGDADARGFECRLERGGTTVSGWAACSDPKTYDLSGEPDGDYDFSVRAVNRAGTPSEPATGAYSLDRGAPAGPSIDSAPGSPGRDDGPAWSFSAEAGASFECRLTSGGATISDWAACSSPEGYDVSGQPDGAYDFGVRATDVAGNTGPATTSAYQLDRTAPGAPSIDSAPAPRTSSTSPAWAFSGEPGAAFECRLTLAGTAIDDWAGCVSPRGFDVAAQPDGLFGFSVRARDAAGNTGAPANSGFELDRAGAVAAITGSPGAIGRDRRPGWSFSSEAGATFQCRLEREGALVESWAACSTPHSYDLTSRPDGTYTFSARGRDATGNSGDPVTSTYVLDGVAPAAPSIEELGSPSRDRRPGWRFDGEPGASFECRLEGSGVLVSGWASCVSPRTFDLAGLGDGVYSLAVRATDAAGNTGPAAGAGYDLDTTPPERPRVRSRAGAAGADTSPAFEFTGERGATYECALTRGGREVSARAACASPQSYDLSSEPDGEYGIAVRGTDAAGNTSAPGGASYALARDAGPDGQPGAGGALPPGIAEPRKPDSEGGAGGSASAPFAAPGANNGGGGGTQGGEREPNGAGDDGTSTAVGKAINEKLAKRLTDIGAATSPPNPAKQGSRVVKTLGQVAGAVARNADKTFFPTLLILMVVGFFGIQNRIDRNDPKLGLSPILADPDLEFGPPPVK